ncbi:MAG: holo-[acyl-carrier-protein] synthase [Elusimicrobia bacterium]|nr:holo-[acyl-carrier-protein] synthase [Elusimicrobiota bacterium]MBD3412225.1 holo-[acyl-carrier-protein] synthase [Elusimicrobiota bacterium]
MKRKSVSQCGVDIVEVNRVKNIARRNKYFLQRVFAPREIKYCMGKKFKWQHFAVRFAAKEAVWKAVGLRGLRLQDISIANAPDGKPRVLIRGKQKKLGEKISISLSHTGDVAIAMAVWNGAS